EQLAGGTLSFNNLSDLQAARSIAAAFQVPACAIVKHAIPCGVAVGGSAEEAWERALASDPVSAFGSVVAFNRPVVEHLGEWDALLFAWRVAQFVRSNAIVLAAGLATVGVGAGQTSRVDAVRLAVAKAGERAAGAAMASDAFFPFPDGPRAALEAGVRAVI